MKLKSKENADGMLIPHIHYINSGSKKQGDV